MTMKHTWNVRFCAAWRMIWKCLSGLSLSISGFRWQSVVSIFSFSPWPSHYSSSSSMPPLWISHLPLPPPFSLFCPSLFSPLFLSHRISLCRSRCRNSLLHINELLISKAKRRPASQPPAASRTLRSLTRSLPLVLSHTLSHTRSATLFAWWADNWYAEVHGDLSRESRDITNLSESLALLPVPAALLGGYSQRVHPNKFFQLLRVICSFMDVHTNTRDHRLTVSVLLAKCTSLFSPSLISIFEWYHSFVKVNIVNTEQQWSHLG